MHLEFPLPSSAGGITVKYGNTRLDRGLAAWSLRWGYRFSKTVVGYRVWVELESPESYLWFAMTWNDEISKWQIKEDDHDSGSSDVDPSPRC